MKHLTLILLATLLSGTPAPAQDTIQQDITFRIDDRGDATLDVEFQLSAKGWMTWKSNYGDHPDLLKRDLIHRFSTLEVDSFKLEKDDTNRRAKATLCARGGARYLGAGKYEIEIPGNWKKVTDTGNQWHFSHAEMVGQGVMLNQTHKIYLPEKAAKAKLGPVTDGQQRLSYAVPAAGGLSLGLILAGVGLIGLLGASVLRFMTGPEAPGLGATRLEKKPA